MHPAVQHLILLLVSGSFSSIGWFVAHKPERTFRVFTFGIRPERRFSVGFFRVWGWFSAVFFAAGTVFYLVLAIVDLIR